MNTNSAKVHAKQLSGRAVRWRIYYQRTTYDNQDGSPESAPARGVVVIVQDDPNVTVNVGRINRFERDFYWYADGLWYGGDFEGMRTHIIDSGFYLGTEPDGFTHRWMEHGQECHGDSWALHDAIEQSGLVKIGVMLGNDEYKRISDLAGADPDFRRKSAYAPGENRPRGTG
jgi:hypothetical protein